MKIAFPSLNAAIAETYLLNLSQVLHMLILAAFVPWYIGVETYGIFAALITLPGIIQSSFEVICVSLLAEYKRRDILVPVIVFFALPLHILTVAAFFWFLAPELATFAAVMAFLLLARSYAFSIAIVSGVLTSKIVQSEFIILAIYVLVSAACIYLDVKTEMMPILMVSLASLATSIFLIFASLKPVRVLAPSPDVEMPRPNLLKFTNAASLRLFEDGFLSLSPLVLAVLFSPLVAGQFRIFVSVAKAAYKFFPFRYEVILRDLNNATLSFKSLIIASGVFVAGAPVAAAMIRGFIFPVEHGLIVALIAVSGAVVASLAMFPAACATDHRMLWVAALGLLVVFAAAASGSFAAFVIAFAFATMVIMLASLWVIYEAVGKQSEM